MTTGPGPMGGDVRGRVAAARPVSIHGDVYYDLVIETGDGAHEQVRAPSHACEREPRVGDDVVVELLLMQATRVRFE